MTQEREILDDINEQLEEEQRQFRYWYARASMLVAEVEIAKAKTRLYSRRVDATRAMVESFHTQDKEI